MANEKAKVTKDGVTKTIQKKDLPDYISMGWKEVKDTPDTIRRMF